MRIEAGLIDPLDALTAPRERPALRVCLVVPQSGALGMTGPSAVEAALLATHEVNVAGGVDGHPVEPVLVDGGAPPPVVAAQVHGLAAAGAIDVVAGFHTSDVHRAIEAAIAGRTPYVFTPPHEGGRRRTGVFCLGTAPVRQLRGSIGWLSARHRLRRWALIGNDYIWPHAMHAAARRLISRAAGQVVLERQVAMGQVSSTIDVLVDDLRRSRPDALLLSLVGRDLADFNRALRHSGLDRSLVRLSGSLEENGLLAYGGDDTGTMYSAMASFASLRQDRRLELAERYERLFGPEAPVLDTYAEGLYDGLHLVAALASEHTLTPGQLRPAAERLVRREGEPSNGAWARSPLGPPPDTVHLARAEGLDFLVVAQS